MGRSAVLLIQDDHVACIERRRPDRLYYVLPGGTIEEDETAEQAAIREAREELGVDIELGPLAAIVMYGERQQSYFWARIMSGEFGSGQGPEFSYPPEAERGSYLPVWLPLATLSEYNLRPPVLARALAAGSIAPGSTPLNLYEEPRGMRSGA